MSSKPTPASELMGIDVYGIPEAAARRLLASYGADLRRFAEASIGNDKSFDARALFTRLAASGDYAYVQPALVGYPQGDTTRYYLTIDVVQRKDASRRMRFLTAPDAQHGDPGGLLRDHEAFHAKVFELILARRMSPKWTACSAFHCFGDHNHPELRPLIQRFRRDVARHWDQLVQIAVSDRSSMKRRSATYLLAFKEDGRAVVRNVVRGFRDSEAIVRNSAMRVVADIASHHPHLALPLEPVLEALDYPSASDRNKASAILAAWVRRPSGTRIHRRVAIRVGATLLAMLRLQQPNNHDFAYRILVAISGKKYGERDYAAWQRWLDTVLHEPQHKHEGYR